MSIRARRNALKHAIEKPFLKRRYAKHQGIIRRIEATRNQEELVAVAKELGILVDSYAFIGQDLDKARARLAWAERMVKAEEVKLQGLLGGQPEYGPTSPIGDVLDPRLRGLSPRERRKAIKRLGTS